MNSPVRKPRAGRIGWVVVACLGLMGLGVGLVGGLPILRDPVEPAPQSADEWPPRLADLAWLTGHWRQENRSALIEELWMPERGGVLLGISRSLEGSFAPATYAFQRLEELDDGIVLVRTPDRGEPVTFRLVEVDHEHAVFANPENEFPKRIEYVRQGEQRLVCLLWGAEAGPAWTLVRAAHID